MHIQFGATSQIRYDDLTPPLPPHQPPFWGGSRFKSVLRNPVQ